MTIEPEPDLCTLARAGRLVRFEAEVDAELIDRLADDPDGLLAEGRPIKVQADDRTSVVRITHGDRDYLLKRANRRGALHTLSHSMLRSRAAWGWLNAQRLLEAGIRTPRPLAMVEERVLSALRLRSYLLTEWIKARPLLELVHSNELSIEMLERIAIEFARDWSIMESRRLSHGDLKATNLLIDSQWNLWWIDLDGMRRHLLPPLLQRAQGRDLARFFRNWRDRPDVERVFRAQIDTA